MHMNTSVMKSDVVILGGGLVGCACAVALHQQGYSVTLIEQKAPVFTHEQTHPLQTDDWDARIYAISPGNVCWLASLGVWEHVNASRVCAVEKMDIYGDTTGYLHFDAYDAHAAQLSYILENRELHAALWKSLLENNVQVVTQTKVAKVTHAENAVEVMLENGAIIEAHLLVGADGGRSWLRQQLEIPVSTSDYAQMGVVANFSVEHNHAQTARQWFKPDSILAYLPLPDKRVSIVWSTSHQHATELLAMQDDSFVRQVTEAGQGVLGTMRCITKPQAFPLQLQSAQRMIDAGCILMGDAAHLVHPLAGQGVNLGFRDVATFAKLCKEKGQFERIGDRTLLRRYERERQSDIIAMQQVTHGLHALFVKRQPTWLQSLRNKGMGWVNQQTRLKEMLIRQAML